MNGTVGFTMNMCVSAGTGTISQELLTADDSQGQHDFPAFLLEAMAPPTNATPPDTAEIHAGVEAPVAAPVEAPVAAPVENPLLTALAVNSHVASENAAVDIDSAYRATAGTGHATTPPEPESGSDVGAFVRGVFSPAPHGSASTAPDAHAIGAASTQHNESEVAAQPTTSHASVEQLPTTATVGASPAATVISSPSSLTTTSAPLSVPTPAATQVYDQLAPRLHLLRPDTDGLSRAVLTLRPADLGVLTVTMEVTAGVVDLTFSGGHAAQAAVRDALSNLRADIAQAGLDLGQVDISDATPDDDSTRSRGDSSGSSGSQRAGSDTSADAPPSEPRRVAAQGLDIHL
jgi:flagellar hook-length control protein FliK